jgi:acetyl-CoA synthetase
MTHEIADRVPSNSPGAAEIGFTIPERYNASRILFDNLGSGRGDRPALIGPAGTRSYRDLCAEASKWGHGFQSLGLKRGDRILMFTDDTPAYPAAFFGAVRAGFVPLLINTLTPPDLLQFYLSDSGTTVAVVDAEFCVRFDAVACKDTALQTLIVVNGAAGDHAAPNMIAAEAWLPGFSADLAEADTHRNEMAFWMYSSGSTGRPKGHRPSGTTWPIARPRSRATAGSKGDDTFFGAEDFSPTVSVIPSLPSPRGACLRCCCWAS